IRFPASALSLFPSTGSRKRGSNTRTRRMVRPTRWGRKLRQTVSTSGSSGIKSVFRVQYFVVAGKEKLIVRCMSEADEFIDTEGLTTPARIYFLRTKKIFNRASLMLGKGRERIAERLAPLGERRAHQSAQHRPLIDLKPRLWKKLDLKHGRTYLRAREKGLRRNGNFSGYPAVNLA